MLESIGTLFTPDAILRWRRLLVAQKWDFSDRTRKKPGRPPVADEIHTLVVRLASENPTWGYDRIHGALANLGHTLSDATVGNILKKHGIEPAPDRKRQTTWQTFLQAHWNVLAAIDFTTIEVWTKNGLVPFYLLFVMELATRRVHFAGCSTNPDQAWMKQVARNLTDVEDGFLNRKAAISSWTATRSSAPPTAPSWRMLASRPCSCRPHRQILTPTWSGLRAASRKNLWAASFCSAKHLCAWPFVISWSIITASGITKAWAIFSSTRAPRSGAGPVRCIAGNASAGS